MSEPAQSRTQWLLVVDDDPAVGQLVSEILDDAGYNVTLANGTASAVAAAEERTYDAVVSDLSLGAESGYDVADALHGIQPGLKVLFMSGSGVPPQTSHHREPILGKPFRASELIARVEQLLS